MTRPITASFNIACSAIFALLLATSLVTPRSLDAQQCAVNDYPTDTFRGGFTQGWGKIFGRSVAVDGATAVVGGAGHAAVYELRDNRWVFVQNLLPPDNLVSSFGFSVAISGSTIAVGDPTLDNQSGAVWVFERSGNLWVRQPTLRPSSNAFPPRPGARFGFAVDMSPGKLLVGAPGYDDQRTNVGFAFLFELSGGQWSEKAQLAPPAGHFNRQDETGFGHSVAIDGGLAAIGMPFDIGQGTSLGDPSKANVGRVSVHEEANGWSATSVRPPQADEGDQFGYALSVSGSDIIVGAPYHSFLVGTAPLTTGRNTSQSGAAFVYTHMGNRSVKLAGLLRPDDYCSGGYTSRFGYSVDIDQDLIAIGAATAGLDQEGEAYLFERRSGRWVEQRLLTKHPRQQGRTDWFGSAVAVTAGWALVGAPRADHNIGEALMFEYP